MEDLLSELKRLYDRQRDIEKERIEGEKIKVNLRKQQLVFINEHQNSKIISLERAYRHAEIEVQKRREVIQKMAQILSHSIGKVVTKTFADFRMVDMTIHEPAKQNLVSGRYQGQNLPAVVEHHERRPQRTFGYKGKTGLDSSTGFLVSDGNGPRMIPGNMPDTHSRRVLHQEVRYGPQATQSNSPQMRSVGRAAHDQNS
jgi:hypothetical protein